MQQAVLPKFAPLQLRKLFVTVNDVLRVVQALPARGEQKGVRPNRPRIYLPD